MRTLILLAIVLFPNHLFADDLGDLQGLWVSLDEPWSVEIHDDTATFRGTHALSQTKRAHLLEFRCRFSLDTKAEPKQFNLNTDDLAAVTKQLKQPADSLLRSRGIFKVQGEELLLEFGFSSPKKFDRRRPGIYPGRSRKLRRVSDEELQSLKPLTGVWKAQLRQEKRVLDINTWLIYPGWAIAVGHWEQPSQSVRMRALPSNNQTQYVLHGLALIHAVTNSPNPFVGRESFNVYSWVPVIGSGEIRSNVATGEFHYLLPDKRLADENFLSQVGMSKNECENLRTSLMRMRGRGPAANAQLKPLAFPLQLSLTKLSEDIDSYATSINSTKYFIPTPEKLVGQWRTVLRKEFRVTVQDDRGGYYEAASKSPSEEWTITAKKLVFRSNDDQSTLTWEPEGLYGHWREIPKRDNRGTISLRYEPLGELLHVHRQYSSESDRWLNKIYVLERVPEKSEIE